MRERKGETINKEKERQSVDKNRDGRKNVERHDKETRERER